MYTCMTMSQVEFVSNLNMYSTANKMRLSGIVCTIGPVSREPATLLELIENGMNVARMNFSHGYAVKCNVKSRLKFEAWVLTTFLQNCVFQGPTSTTPRRWRTAGRRPRCTRRSMELIPTLRLLSTQRDRRSGPDCWRG